MNSLAIRVPIDSQVGHSNNLDEQNFMNPSSSLSSPMSSPIKPSKVKVNF